MGFPCAPNPWSLIRVNPKSTFHQNHSPATQRAFLARSHHARSFWQPGEAARRGVHEELGAVVGGGGEDVVVDDESLEAWTEDEASKSFPGEGT